MTPPRSYSAATVIRAQRRALRRVASLLASLPASDLMRIWPDDEDEVWTLRELLVEAREVAELRVRQS